MSWKHFKGLAVDNMKKTGFNDYVYDFSVDYDAGAADDTLGIYKYLMKKIIKYNKMFGFIKKAFLMGLTVLSDLTGVNSLGCIPMDNQECKVRSEIINVNSDEAVFYPFSINSLQ